MSKLDEFLAGERLDDVALFLTHEFLDEQGRIANYGETVENGVVLVVPGDDGRRMFSAGTGMDAMEFAQTASGSRGRIDPDLGGGDCPAAGGGDGDGGDGGTPDADAEGESEDADDADGEHGVQFVFAFAEEQNEGVGGVYAEGDVIHAYAHCACGENYSQKWVVGDRDDAGA